MASDPADVTGELPRERFRAAERESGGGARALDGIVVDVHVEVGASRSLESESCSLRFEYSRAESRTSRSRNHFRLEAPREELLELAMARSREEVEAVSLESRPQELLLFGEEDLERAFGQAFARELAREALRHHRHARGRQHDDCVTGGEKAREAATETDVQLAPVRREQHDVGALRRRGASSGLRPRGERERM
jgi:hypothetical protein